MQAVEKIECVWVALNKGYATSGRTGPEVLGMDDCEGKSVYR